MDEDIINYIIENSFEFIIGLKVYKSRLNIISLIRIIGNLCSNENSNTSYIVSHGAIQILEPFLSSQDTQIIKESLWAISNIADGSEEEVHLIYESMIINKVLSYVLNKNSELAINALYTIANIVNKTVGDNYIYILNFKIIDYLLKFLKSSLDNQMTYIALASIEYILNLGNNVKQNDNPNIFIQEIIKKEGLEILEKSLSFNNEDIFKLVSKLLDNYFNLNLISNK